MKKIIFSVILFNKIFTGQNFENNNRHIQFVRDTRQHIFYYLVSFSGGFTASRIFHGSTELSVPAFTAAVAVAGNNFVKEREELALRYNIACHNLADGRQERFIFTDDNPYIEHGNDSLKKIRKQWNLDRTFLENHTRDCLGLIRPKSKQERAEHYQNVVRNNGGNI